MTEKLSADEKTAEAINSAVFLSLVKNGILIFAQPPT